MSKCLLRFQSLQTFCHTGLQGTHGHAASVDTGLQGTHGYAVSIDIITQQLERLIISDRKKNAAKVEQKALVPYKGSGTIIPYDGSDPIKRRKARPRVDLDPETNRLWNVLMGKEGGTETMDKDNEKWWEDERKVVRGRVDSFVARMRLVQGNKESHKPSISTTTHQSCNSRINVIVILSSPTRQII